MGPSCEHIQHIGIVWFVFFSGMRPVAAPHQTMRCRGNPVTRDSIDVMLQSFAIMGQSIAGYELTGADIIIRPDTGSMRGTDFDNRQNAIIEGEKATQAAIAEIKRKIADKTTMQTITR